MVEDGTEPTVVRTSRGLSIAGTRLTLYDILEYLHAEWSPRLIQHWFNLTEQQIADVMAYIAANRDAVEAEYQQILQQAEANRTYWEARNRDRLAQIATLPSKAGKEQAIAKLRAHKAEMGYG